MTIDKIRAKIPNANNLQLNTDKPSKGLLAQILGALSRRRLSKSAPFFYSYAKKEGESQAARLLFFLTQAKRGAKNMIKPIPKKEKNIKIYIVFEFKEEKDEWYNKASYSTLAEAIDFIKTARSWEKRWKELGFAYAPPATIYKIVEFKSGVEFIEQ